MIITVQFFGLTSHTLLEERIKKKVGKLETFYDKIQSCRVFLKVENTNDKQNKTAELILDVPGDDIIVKKTTTNFQESIDNCVGAAKKILIRKKETTLVV